MEAAGEAHRQAAAAQRPLQQAHRIEMADQGQGAGLGEAETQPAHPLTGRRARRNRRRRRRRWNHHVVAQLGAADAAAAAAGKGTVLHHRRRQGPLQILRQPGFVDTGIDVIPGQGLAAKGGQIIAAEGLGAAPAPHLQLAIAAAQPRRLNGAGPGGVGALGGFKPGIEAGAGPPGCLQHRRQAPIAAADEVLHRRQTHIGEIDLDPPQLAQGPAQQLLAPLELGRADAVPLKGGVGLGREVADREIQLQPAQIPAALLQRAAGVGDAEHVVVALAGQADHEIELDLAIAGLHRRADAAQQFLVAEALVDDVAQALGAGFGGEGEPRLAGTAEDMGDVGVEAIDPLARQGEGDVLVSEPVAQLHPHRRQRQIVAATQRQQREIGVAGAAHALLHRLNHRLGLHIAGGAGEHAGLTEATTAGAAAADLDGEAVVDRFDVGHQPHGVVGHRRGGAPLDAHGQPRLQGLHRHPIGGRAVERGHVDPRHQSQIPQGVRAAQTGGAGLSHHQADLGQQLLAIAEGDEIEEGRERFGIAGGGGPAGKDQRRGGRISQGQVAASGSTDGDAGQIEHLEDVAGPELVAEAEAEDVEGGQGPAALDRKQGHTPLT